MAQVDSDAALNLAVLAFDVRRGGWRTAYSGRLAPEVAAGSSLKELLDAVGPVGVGIALSFAAFLVGSLSEDLASLFFRVRGARAFSLETRAPAFLTIRNMPDSVRAELERLEATIDRTGAELVLRLGLIPPGSCCRGRRCARWVVLAG